MMRIVVAKRGRSSASIYHSPLAFIRTLLEIGADPNRPTDDGFPPLIAALSCTRPAPGATARSSFVSGLFYGVEGMRVGGTRRLEIAPHLAYGDRGVPGVIPAGALLAEITVLEACQTSTDR